MRRRILLRHARALILICGGKRFIIEKRHCFAGRGLSRPPRKCRRKGIENTGEAASRGTGAALRARGAGSLQYVFFLFPGEPDDFSYFTQPAALLAGVYPCAKQEITGTLVGSRTAAQLMMNIKSACRPLPADIAREPDKPSEPVPAKPGEQPRLLRKPKKQQNMLTGDVLNEN
jgi:hypothetical protein